ncbi:MAG TPA: glycosyltransferase family 2 protein [Candidatus Merdivicinus intestinigallinarum]|nr:glycosyltransferase family 2 protein [Candidatus Merdivicinus intestinigallinarum]
MDRITVVVPCYNEQEVLPVFYKEICRTAEKMAGQAQFEFLFVDDGSNDRTKEILKELRQTDPRVCYLSFSRNFGKEAGIYAGLQHASGNYVAVMDADLQHPPAFLPQMYEAVASGEYDCASTRRVSRKGEKPLRSLFARMFYKVNNAFSQVKMVEGAQDFRFMSRQMVDAVLELSERNRFTKGIFNWVGFRTKYLEYENVERAAGQTKWSFWGLLRYSLEGILAFSAAPLLLAPILGGCFLLAGFVMLILRLCALDVSLLCAALFLVGGSQLLCLGILGAYFSKMYWEVKKRPIYILKEIQK